MTDDERPIRIVFDTSAILAFTRGSIHAGEPLSEIDSEGGAVGLPTPCLAEVRWMVADLDRLNYLLEHRATDLIPAPEDWVALAALQDITGRQDAAAAVLLALDFQCDVLSALPGLYGGMAAWRPGHPHARLSSALDL